MSASRVLSIVACALLAFAIAGRAAPSNLKPQSQRGHQRTSAGARQIAGVPQEKTNSNTGASSAAAKANEQQTAAAARSQKRSAATEAPSEQDDLFEFDDVSADTPANDGECGFLNDSDRFARVLQEEMRQNSGDSLKVRLCSFDYTNIFHASVQ